MQQLRRELDLSIAVLKVIEEQDYHLGQAANPDAAPVCKLPPSSAQRPISKSGS
jgi:hypothetical protein